MNDLAQNGKLKWLLVANFVTVTCIIFNVNDELRETFELVPYPTDEFKQSVIKMLLIDLVWCYVVEKMLVKFYLRTFVREED